MTNDAVVFEAVSKSYGAVPAIDGLDLAVRPGETVALLGANGAGKSTLVQLMLGLLAPDAGVVRVLGQDPHRVVAEGRIGVMLQDGGLMAGVRVRALVELAAGMYRSPRAVDRLLAEADLTAIAGRRVDRLSGGQTQRLRFAVAIAGNPQVLVLDEPTTAMDIESRRAFWAVIRGYAAEGHTVLFATHFLQEADEFADRIIVLARGRVVAHGSATQLKAAAGERTVRFTLGEQRPAALDRLPGVTSVQLQGMTAALRTTNTEATVRALFATRNRVPDLEVGGAGLEDAVLALTGSSLQE